MTDIAIQEQFGGSAVAWVEPVSRAQYPRRSRAIEFQPSEKKDPWTRRYRADAS